MGWTSLEKRQRCLSGSGFQEVLHFAVILSPSHHVVLLLETEPTKVAEFESPWSGTVQIRRFLKQRQLSSIWLGLGCSSRYHPVIICTASLLVWPVFEPAHLCVDNVVAQFEGHHGSETIPRRHWAQMRPSPVGEEGRSAAWLWAILCHLFVGPEGRASPILFAGVDLMSRCCSQFSCCHVSLKAATLFGF